MKAKYSIGNRFIVVKAGKPLTKNIGDIIEFCDCRSGKSVCHKGVITNKLSGRIFQINLTN